MTTPLIFSKKDRQKSLATIRIGYRISLKAKNSETDKLTIGELREIQKKLNVKLNGTLIDRHIMELLTKTFTDQKITISVVVQPLNMYRL